MAHQRRWLGNVAFLLTFGGSAASSGIHCAFHHDCSETRTCPVSGRDRAETDAGDASPEVDAPTIGSSTAKDASDDSDRIPSRVGASSDDPAPAVRDGSSPKSSTYDEAGGAVGHAGSTSLGGVAGSGGADGRGSKGEAGGAAGADDKSMGSAGGEAGAGSGGDRQSGSSSPDNSDSAGGSTPRAGDAGGNLQTGRGAGSRQAGGAGGSRQAGGTGGSRQAGGTGGSRQAGGADGNTISNGAGGAHASGGSMGAGGTVACPTYYPDSDGDGYGDATHPLASCTKPTGYVTNGDDCCDTDSRAKPGQTQAFELANACGSFDFNCDGKETPQSNGPTGCSESLDHCVYDGTDCVPSGSPPVQCNGRFQSNNLGTCGKQWAIATRGCNGADCTGSQCVCSTHSNGGPGGTQACQ